MMADLRLEQVAFDEHGPALPLEEGIAGAVRGLEAVKARADMLLLQLQYSPRRVSEVLANLDELGRQAENAAAAYARYAHILECRGQA